MQSKADFEKLEAELVDRWSPSFAEYLSRNLRDDVDRSTVFSTAHLDTVSLPYVGLTNNVLESYNRVLKDFQNWKVNSTCKLSLIVVVDVFL